MSARLEARRRIRGIYAIADADAADGDPLRLAALWLEAGARVIQLRAKSWSEDEIVRAGIEVAARARGRATLILNDHPHLVAEVGADGVHVGQTDGPTDTIRAIVGEDRIIGRSTNDPTQVAATLPGADYLAFGPLFPTANLSRPKDVQGLARLVSVRAQVEVPLVGIGGITLERLDAVRTAGADAWAVIGAVARAADPEAAAAAWVARS